jgi:hypothetical protein
MSGFFLNNPKNKMKIENSELERKSIEAFKSRKTQLLSF